MAHCSKCGNVVDSAAPFCHKCGAAQSVAPVAAPAPSAASFGTQTSLTENVAALLSYSLLWITGLIFLLIDKRPYVKFHAAQSLVAFGALQVLSIVVRMVFGAGAFLRGPVRWADFGVGAGIHTLIDVVTLILWVVGMIKAYQHETFRIPIAAEIADQIAAS